MSPISMSNELKSEYTFTEFYFEYSVRYLNKVNEFLVILMEQQMRVNHGQHLLKLTLPLR
jgi:hypothetical protein